MEIVQIRVLIDFTRSDIIERELTSNLFAKI